jgi:hypothetical protein
MKRICLLMLFWGIASAVTAQSQFRQAVDAAFVNLDKSGITSGILYDRVFPAANLLEAGVASSPAHFRQAHSELYEASYSTEYRLTPTDLDNLAYESQQRRVVPIGILLTDFQVCNTGAIELNNGQYRLRNGYNVSQLYQTRQAVVTSMLSASIARGTTAFQLPLWAIFNQSNAAITSITIDFGDGNPVLTLTPGNQTTTAYYGSAGEKTISFTLNLADGSQRTARSVMTVGEAFGEAATSIPPGGALRSNYLEPGPRDGLGPIDRVVIESDEAFQGYDESSATKGKANAYFYYGQGRDNVRKPVIVLDGFDGGDTRGPDEIYRTRLRYIDQAGEGQRLGDDLRESNPARQNEPDYNSDVIILNFPRYEYARDTRTVCGSRMVNGVCTFGATTLSIPRYRDGGVDYIERNALVLVKLLNVVNERLRASGSTEKITLIGPSMGGLISRYALRYMELRGMDANCKLWVSFDSPHNGANIPIGGQQFLEYFANGLGLESAKAALNSQVDSPAAKQLLLHHYRNGETAGGAPGFRDRFASTLSSFGYPTAACLRKVALSNGSKNGTPQNLAACQEALKLNARLTDFGTLTCFVGFGLSCLVARDRILDARVYTAPSGSGRCLTMRKTLTAFGAGAAERYAVGRGNNQPSNDTQPGGIYDVLGEIAADSRTAKWLYRVNVDANTNGTTFIPTVSSYGLYNTDRNWGASLDNVNVTAETPFNAIYAPDANEPHVLLTNAGVNFVREQIRQANSQCAQPQTPITTPSLQSGACYIIKSQKTGRSLQAVGNGIQQQPNGSQIWKLDDAGNNRYRFTVQDGTNRVITTPNGNYGELLTLTNATGADNQAWALAQNGSTGNYRMTTSNGTTWDLQNYGNDPGLQLWGNATEPFYDYRSFRFESATCPTGSTPTPTPTPTPGGLAFQIVSYDCNTGVIRFQVTGGNGSPIQLTLHGLFSDQVTANTVYSATYPSDGRTGRTTSGQATQSGNQVAISFTNGCNLTGTPTPTPTPTPGALAFQIVSYDCNTGLLRFQLTGGNGAGIQLTLYGLFSDQVTANTIYSATYPADGRTGRTTTGQATQSGNQINISFTNGCNLGSGGRLAAPGALTESEQETVVYPNPAQTELTVSLRDVLPAEPVFVLTDVLGRVQVVAGQLTVVDERTLRLAVRQLAAGHYVLRITGGTAPGQTVRFVKQ